MISEHYEAVGKFIYTFPRMAMTLEALIPAMGGTVAGDQPEFDEMLDEFERRLGGVALGEQELERAQNFVTQGRALCVVRTAVFESGADLDLASATGNAAAALAARELLRRVEEDVLAACARRES